MTLDEVMQFVFSQIGRDAGDEKLADAAQTCVDAATSLFAAIKDDRVRERALVEQDFQLADTARKVSDAVDAVQRSLLSLGDRTIN